MRTTAARLQMRTRGAQGASSQVAGCRGCGVCSHASPERPRNPGPPAVQAHRPERTRGSQTRGCKLRSHGTRQFVRRWYKPGSFVLLPQPRGDLEADVLQQAAALEHLADHLRPGRLIGAHARGRDQHHAYRGDEPPSHASLPVFACGLPVRCAKTVRVPQKICRSGGLTSIHRDLVDGQRCYCGSPGGKGSHWTGRRRAATVHRIPRTQGAKGARP